MSFGHKKEGGLGGGLFGKESNLSPEVYLNLTPLMDVMSNILFFLLASFGASVIAILPTTVPVRSDDSSVDSALDRVTVTLRVDSQGLTINCESGVLTDEQLAAYRARLVKRNGDYDLEALTAALRRIKERFPGSKTMVMVPDDELKYDVLVHLMDASRDTRLPTGQRLELFSEVVMSGIASAAPGAAPAPAAAPVPLPVVPPVAPGAP